MHVIWSKQDRTLFDQKHWENKEVPITITITTTTTITATITITKTLFSVTS